MGMKRLSTCSQLHSGWQLFSAVCLERVPMLTNGKNELEETFSDLMSQLEGEYSVLSDHELRHREDIKLAEGRSKDDDNEEISGEVIRQTALEMEDKWEAELHAFQPASRTTEADLKNDTRSTNRKLDRKLLLLIKQKLGDPEVWMMPQEKRQEGESMRETAERALKNASDGDISATFLGNAPVGFYKYKYPKDVQENGAVGAKIFFFKAQLKEGQSQFKSNTNMLDHAWVSKDELSKYLVPKYNATVQKFVLEV